MNAPAPRIPTGAAVLVLADVLLLLVAGVATFVDGLPTLGAGAAWSLRGVLLLSLVADVGAFGLSGNALVWRRRLALVVLGFALWRGGALRDDRWLQAGVVVWTGAVWVALVLAGRALQRALVESTGSEGLPEA